MEFALDFAQAECDVARRLFFITRISSCDWLEMTTRTKIKYVHFDTFSSIHFNLFLNSYFCSKKPIFKDYLL
jgi:hypothetical protein